MPTDVVKTPLNSIGKCNYWRDFVLDVESHTLSFFIDQIIESTCVIGLVFLSMGVAVIGGYSNQLTFYDEREERALLKSLFMGIILTGLFSAKKMIIDKTGPLWMDMSNLNDLSPSFGMLNDNLMKCVSLPAFMMFLFYFCNQISHQFQKNKLVTILAVFLSGFLMAGTNAGSIIEWLEIGVVNGIIIVFIYLLLYKKIGWLPIVFLVPLVFSLLEQAFKGHVDNLIPGILITIAFICFFSVFWFIRVKKS